MSEQPLRRIVLGTPMVLYSAPDGSPIALQDRCPHRFAPLSRGRIVGDRIECGYHGLVFDRTGACVENPHGHIIAPQIQVEAYPITVRYGLVWVWPGDRYGVDLSAIPDLNHMIAPGLKTVHSLLEVSYRADILVDNLMDLSHADYLHVGSFSGGAPRRAETRVREEGDIVVVTRDHFDAPPAPAHAHLGSLVDMRYEICWHPGNVMTYFLTVRPVDGPAYR